MAPPKSADRQKEISTGKQKQVEDMSDIEQNMEALQIGHGQHSRERGRSFCSQKPPESKSENFMADITDNWNPKLIISKTQANVYKITLDGEVMIVKAYPNQPPKDKYFEVERNFLCQSNEQPNIVKAVAYNKEKLCLLMKFYPQPLKEAIPALEWKDTLKILQQTSGAIKYIHTLAAREKMIHMDIKTENILLDKGNNAYLADFGSMSIEGSTNEVAVSDVYVPPELDNPYNKKGRTQKVDIYAFGLVILQLLGKKQDIELVQGDRNTSYPDILVAARKESASSLHPELRKDGDTTKSATKLLELGKKCASHRPESRPSIIDVCAALKKI